MTREPPLPKRLSRFPRTPALDRAFASPRAQGYATRSTNRAARRMLQHLPRPFGAILAVLLMSSPCMHGQVTTSDSSDNAYTEGQSDAIDRVDELVGRLQSMQWGPEVVNALSTLGAVACQYDRELGVRAFEAAYAVVAGFEYDLEDDWGTLRGLSRLAAAAPRCDASFGDRPLPLSGPAADLRAKGLLEATWESLQTDPHQAAELALGMANQVHNLAEHDQVFFARALRELREQLPADADGLFRNLLSNVAGAGTLGDLFALGNYVLGPDPETGAIEAQTAIGHLLSAARPGVPKELIRHYVGTAIEMLLTRGTPTRHDARSIGLAIQLESWAKTNAPEYLSTLESLLTSQPDSLEIREQLSEFREQIERSTSLRGLEEELGAAIEEQSKSRLSFELCMNLVEKGEFSRAEDLLNNLEPELGRRLRDFIGLRRAAEAIASDRLEDASIEVAGLNDSLHQVLGGLSLAREYWARSVDVANPSGEDRDAADQALRRAMGAVENVPDHLRPHARIAIAAVLANCDQGEEGLRVLELALLELRPDQSREETEEEESEFLVTPQPWGGFGVEISDGYSAIVQDLHPPNLEGTNFEEAVHLLSLSPEMDLDRLDAISSRAIDSRMRAEGLVAVAKVALARAFDAKMESPSTDEPANPVSSSNEAVDQSAN